MGYTYILKSLVVFVNNLNVSTLKKHRLKIKDDKLEPWSVRLFKIVLKIAGYEICFG